MQRQSLASSAILSAGYDPERKELELELEFHNGRVYRYRGVPQGAFDFLLRAPSKGGYVNRMIDGRYPYEDVTEAGSGQDLEEALLASLRHDRDPMP